MFDALQLSWEFAKESLSLLGRNKRLLLFPIMSGMAALLITVTFCTSPVARAALHDVLAKKTDSAAYVWIFAFYYLDYLVIIFFNSALIACASISLAGGEASVTDGLAVALKRLPRIAVWAAVAATVGLLLRILHDRSERLGQLVSRLLGFAWTLGTYFIVPVIVMEDLGVGSAIERSGELFTRVWGVEISERITFGALWMVASIPGFLAAGYGLTQHALAWLLAAIAYFALLAAVASATNGIFTAALYRYALAGAAPGGLYPGMLEAAFFGTNAAQNLPIGRPDRLQAAKGRLTDIEAIHMDERDTYLIRVQVGNTLYEADYSVSPAVTAFRPDAWQPGMPVQVRTYGQLLLIQAPGYPELRCRFLKYAHSAPGAGA